MSKTIYRVAGRIAFGCLIAAMSCGPAAAGNRFTPCDDAALPGLAGSLCAISQTPLRPDDPETGVVDLFVRKFPSTSGTTTGQVWLIAGGPGESGASFYPFLDTLRAAFPNRDLIIPDHRGTGYSTRLCPVEEAADSPGGYALAGAEWGSCIGGMYADLDRTQAFTVTNASHDLSTLIARYRSEGSVQVYGVSYGTQLILRMLQTAPVGLDAVVLDGLVPLEASAELDLSHRTAVVDKVGRSLLSPDQVLVYEALLSDPERHAL
jgi:pimeloyl-ACP methyl ester carboxylesterase